MVAGKPHAIAFSDLNALKSQSGAFADWGVSMVEAPSGYSKVISLQ
jgi:hypothetical protein